jgi:hypothetical protein
LQADFLFVIYFNSFLHPIEIHILLPIYSIERGDGSRRRTCNS